MVKTFRGGTVPCIRQSVHATLTLRARNTTVARTHGDGGGGGDGGGVGGGGEGGGGDGASRRAASETIGVTSTTLLGHVSAGLSAFSTPIIGARNSASVSVTFLM